MNRRVATANVADVTLEVLYVNRIETDDSLREVSSDHGWGEEQSAYSVESDIRFRHVFTVIVRSRRLGKLIFRLIERFEKLLHSRLVSFLSAVQELVLLQYVLEMHYERRKTTLVDT